MCAPICELQSNMNIMYWIEHEYETNNVLLDILKYSRKIINTLIGFLFQCENGEIIKYVQPVQVL